MSGPSGVIVTGASSGLGSGLARAIDRAGARVVITARRADRLEDLAADLTEPVVVPADLADEAGRQLVVETAIAELGRIDGLVNNAAQSSIAPAFEEPIETFRELLETNLVAPFELSRLTARHMSEHGGGSIVNIASVAGFRATGPTIPQAAYCASKGGLLNLTRELAAQWAEHEIRVNAVAPGLFRTEMVDALLEAMPDALERPMEGLPIKRPGEQPELDAAVRFLLGPESSYITGQVLPVDGGFSAR